MNRAITSARIGSVSVSAAPHSKPFINSAAEFVDIDHPTRLALADHQAAILDWFETELRAAGKAEPGQLAEQLTIVVAGAMVCAGADRSRRWRDGAVAAAETLLRSGS